MIIMIKMMTMMSIQNKIHIAKRGKKKKMNKKLFLMY